MEREGKCPFCAELQHNRELNEYLVKSSNRPEKTRIQYLVALVQKTSYGGYPCGSTTSQSFPLNHCPVCGKKVDAAELVY